jgi:hypothetical protein
MFRRPIRNLRSSTQDRFCDVIIDKGEAFLEVKNSRKRVIKIPWTDVKNQVRIAKEEEAKK